MKRKWERDTYSLKEIKGETSKNKKKERKKESKRHLPSMKYKDGDKSEHKRE
jgi:hypothetical protein